ncbi:MAG: hypothetical protein HY22_05750 [[Candidatus Thermochlorobacteriaceae] bacterium GBChlB]|jgi:hypothetical protein|nr:MAG: hypothetical protein HY22_05750 [[Candidatus Thermochlorobacteriaceae] bacterium GBChlB]
MLKIYRHKEKPNVIITEYTQSVTANDVLTFRNYLSQWTPETGKLLMIADFVNAFVTDNKFLGEISKLDRDNVEKFEMGYIVGVQGIKKILFKMFLSVSAGEVKNQRDVADSLDAAYQKCGVGGKHEFELVAQSQ